MGYCYFFRFGRPLHQAKSSTFNKSQTILLHVRAAACWDKDKRIFLQLKNKS